MILTINGKQAALKKGSSIEYVSENRIFSDDDDKNIKQARDKYKRLLNNKSPKSKRK